MPSIFGGMEFRQGAIERLPPLPKSLPAQPIRLTCAVRPEVAAGQVVRRGQLLADPPIPVLSAVMSPIKATVKAVIPWRQTPRGRTLYDVLLEPVDDSLPTVVASDPPRGRTLDTWFTLLRRFGPWQECDARMDLIRQLAAARQRAPDTLICVGIDVFAPYPDRSSLLASFPDDAVLGTQILADVVGARQVLMLVAQHSSALARIRPSCRNFRVPLAAVNNVYPSADPTMVLWSHAGRRRLPRGAMPTDCGVVLIGPWTAIRLARWFTQRELDLVRPVMIGWPEPGTPMTPVYAMSGQTLVSVHGALSGNPPAMAGRVVLGNPMTGRPVTSPHLGGAWLDPVVPPDELLVSVLSPVKPLRAEPCISCGWCAEVCPTELRPIRLARLAVKGSRASRRQSRQLQRHLDWCIDCGLCSHVCPSDLPLAQTLRIAANETARRRGGEQAAERTGLAKIET